MFKGQFKEARCGSAGEEADAVCIGEIGPSAFVELLRYLYTDDLSVFTEANLVEVLRKAREMELGRVAAHTLSRCTSGLTEHNAAERLIAARRGGLKELDEAAFRFVTHNFKLVRDAAPDGLSALNEFDSKLFEAVVLQAVLT
jgi:succinate dehydrogenase flavin-adding protein (antitoxin of CptAB toxin-antitoxin module)